MQDRRPKLNSTKSIPNPHKYISALLGEFKDYAFDEERASLFKGVWRSEVFKTPLGHPIDVEVGTGNGNHFAHHAMKHKGRSLVGFELKYKPLIQSIRRVINAGGKNARIARFHAHNIDQVFAVNEINNVYIHFPDPWDRPKHYKNRIVKQEFLERLYGLQQEGSFVEFKTDSRSYFLWAMKEIKKTKYKIEFETLNLHGTDKASENFITTFEKIFIRQGIEINYVLLRK